MTYEMWIALNHQAVADKYAELLLRHDRPEELLAEWCRKRYDKWWEEYNEEQEVTANESS